MLNTWSLSLLLFYITWTTALDKKALREKLMSDQDFVAVRDKCLSTVGLTEDELKSNVDTSDVSENVLCFLKCIQQERGFIDETGSIHLEILRNSPHFTALTEDEQNKILQCVEGVAKAVREKLMANKDFVAVRDKCLTTLGLTEDDLNLDMETSDVSENVLCLLKCIQQERGYIDEAGSFHSEKVFSSPHFTALTENEQNEVKKCVEGVDKIETCQDVAPLQHPLDTETNLNDDKSEIDYDCLNESNATVDLLKQYHGEESKEMLCFIKCRFRKQNFIYEDGTAQKDEKEMDMYEECFIEYSVDPAENLTSLVPEDYENIPENELCAYKCIYSKSGFIDDNDEVVVEKIYAIPELQKISKSKVAKMIDCLRNVGEIDECKKVLDLDRCFNIIM
ncbi:hypothetical protein GEV33_009533 [Tenebrio molitor]|uniref:Uncharacterized protein n=1 Tax=Tenebrio molitor TaxID=7067 RepID=A0A8J6HGK4_TENMO|nr:hypothetical protein GEV33_009533 [Tenebrio molitor]